jgi:hypothetical protein
MAPGNGDVVAAPAQVNQPSAMRVMLQWSIPDMMRIVHLNPSNPGLCCPQREEPGFRVCSDANDDVETLLSPISPCKIVASLPNPEEFCWTRFDAFAKRLLGNGALDQNHHRFGRSGVTFQLGQILYG